MRHYKTASIALCLMPLCGCWSGPEIISQPPEIIKVDKPVAPPAECTTIRPLTLPAGTTANDALLAQHRLILAYEAQVRACGQVSSGP